MRGMPGKTLPRLVENSLREHLGVMPAVVITGARQTGKSTLAMERLPGRRRLLSLDDLDVLDEARQAPLGLLSGSEPITVDEVQRAPDLLLSIKRVIDKRRQPGQFLLTGSANLLLMRRVSESLAGRAGYLTLGSMTRREQQGHGACGVWEDLLAARDEDWLDLIAARSSAAEDWRELARRGGFPIPALQLKTAGKRKLWFDGYVTTYLERDLRQVSSIGGLPDFRRLMKAAALRLGQLVNQAELGRDIGMSQPTVHRYLNLLETTYVIARVPAYFVNRTKRLIKSPKLYWRDTGLALHVSGQAEPSGAHLENVVLQDLLAWRDARLESAEIHHWRSTIGEEVDFVIEAGGQLVPIEIKATARPRLRDAANVRRFQTEYGDSVRAGLLLHGGDGLEWIAPRTLAAPWWTIL